MPLRSMPPPNLELEKCICGDDCTIFALSNGFGVRLCRVSDVGLANMIVYRLRGVTAGWQLLSMLNGEMAIMSVESDLWYIEAQLDELLSEQERRRELQVTSTAK